MPTNHKPYDVKVIEPFKKESKRLIKKYASLQNEILELIQSLKENPEQGISIGKDCYKIRLSIASKGKGKSGGARIITNVAVRNEIVYLLSIYDKADIENISDKELSERLKFIEQ